MNLRLREKVIISFARNVLSKLLIRFLIFFELYSNFTGVNCVEIEEFSCIKIYVKSSLMNNASKTTFLTGVSG